MDMGSFLAIFNHHMHSHQVNLWHFTWIAVGLSLLLSLLLSELLHGRILWQYPFSATLIASLVATSLIYVIQRLLKVERTLAEHQAEQARERLKTEVALHESQQRFTCAFHDAAIGMALGTLEGKWLMVNPALCSLVGYTEQELMGITYQDITHPDDLEADLALFRKMLRGEIRTYQMEKRYVHKQGHVVWILLTVSMVRDSAGQPLYCIGQMQDITERKRIQEHLTESQMLFKAILDNSPNLIFLKDREGRYMLVNRQFENIFHLNGQSIMGKTDQELFSAEQAAMFQTNDRKVFESGVPMEFEELAHHDDGPHTSIVYKFPLRTAEGEVCCIGGITTDITARKKVDQALIESEQRLRMAFEDRERLSLDLHDHVIQSIYAIGMALETSMILIENDPKLAACKLQKGIVDLNAVINQLRDYVEWGGKNIIKAEQLSQALEDLVGTMPTTDFEIELKIDSSGIKELTDHMATHILHIAREALTNTLRHANAKSSKVSLSRTTERWYLHVHDDGIGFDLKAKDGYGRGLRNMAARAAKLNANFQIMSECGKGTRISLDIPRNQHAQR
jgi:PAS domain S-box-containing protein